MDEVRLLDGRGAQLWTGGASSGPAVLVCHGTRDTRWVARTGAAVAESLGVRLVCVNRPGYGASTPCLTTTRSVAADAMAVLDALGLDQVSVLGMSVGAVYAAALASLHADRVAALAVVAAPLEAATSAGTESMIEQIRSEFDAWAATIDIADPHDGALATRWLGGLPAADAAALSAVLSNSEVAASAREALSRHDGYLLDAAVLLSPWASALTEVRARTYLWYGAHDDRNPPTTGGWWADRIEGARLRITPTTHLATLLTGWEAILTDLVTAPTT